MAKKVPKDNLNNEQRKAFICELLENNEELSVADLVFCYIQKNG